MLAKYGVLWITTSLILASAIKFKDQSQRGGGPRISVPGGRPVKQGEFPFLVLLVIDISGKKQEFCTGTIVSLTTVLSAARCHLGKITAFAGLVSYEEIKSKQNNIQERSVESVLTPDNQTYIMICYIKQPWVWSNFVGKVVLDLSPESPQREPPRFSCQVMGFGQTKQVSKSGVAHVMDQLIGPREECIEDYLPVMLMFAALCSKDVEDKTVCSGDFGGPAMCGGEQRAIIIDAAPRLPQSLPPGAPLPPVVEDPEWGQGGPPIPVIPQECLPPMGANLYADIDYYRKWLLENIKDYSSADSHSGSVKVSMNEVLLYELLWLFLLMTSVLIYLH